MTHGTRKCYAAGCREAACVTAFRRWRKGYDIRVLRAGGPLKVPAEPVRRHVEMLNERMTLEAIAAVSGISARAIRTIASSQFETVRPRTAARILAVKPDAMPDGHWISSVGATRRVQALQTLGWTLAKLNGHLGNLSDGNGHLRGIASGNANHVHVAYHRRICALYEQLWDCLPEPASYHERAAITSTKRRAAARGWAPPLAWDDDTIDDPDATPTGLTDDGHECTVDKVEWWLTIEPMATAQQCADRFGLSRAAVQQACGRAGRSDLLAQLARNVELAA